MITESAIKTTEGKVYTGKRHHNIFANYPDVNFKYGVQGFITDAGEFLNRSEALIHAIENNQVLDRNEVRGSVLCSEDLW